MDLPQRMSPSQFAQARVGQDFDTILALLADIEVLKAEGARKDAQIAELEKKPAAKLKK